MKKVHISFLIVLPLLMVGLVSAEEPAAPTKPWKNELELGGVSTNGNTKTSSAAGKETFNYKWTRTSLELIGSGMNAKTNNVTTAEKYLGSEKFSYSLDERNYLFEKGAWDRDRFAGINNRYIGTGGVGRALIAKPKDLLIGELGAGYTSEERKNEPVNNFTSGRVYGKYTRTISETAKFTQDAEYLHNFDNPEDFRVNTETALIAALSVHFSLKVSYVWKYSGQPPTGIGRNDTTTAVSLVTIY